MVDGLDDDDLALKSSRRASVLPGLVVIILGLLALAIAAVEYLINAGIANSAGHDDGWLGLSFGTAAYIAGYAGAGVVLVVLGIWKIYRAGIES
jgi:hypothetical protein